MKKIFFLTSFLLSAIIAFANPYYYADVDHDGYPNFNVFVRSVKAPAGYITPRLDGLWDCNDSDASIHPNATELQNNIDDNCNGQIDEGFNPPTLILTATADSSNPDLNVMGAVGTGAFNLRYNLNTPNAIAQIGTMNSSAIYAPNVLSFELVSYPQGDRMNNDGGFNTPLSSPCKSSKIDLTQDHNNFGCYNWGNSLMPATLSLCRTLHIPFIPAVRPQEPVSNIIAWCHQVHDSTGADPRYLVVGDEEFTKTDRFPNGGIDYVNYLIPIIDSVHKYFPNTKIVLDWAPSDLGGSQISNWDAALLTLVAKYPNIVCIRFYAYDFHMCHSGIAGKPWIATLDSIADLAFADRVNIYYSAAHVPLCGLEWGRGEGVASKFPYQGTWAEGYYVCKQQIAFNRYDESNPGRLGFMAQFGIEAFNLNTKVVTQSYLATVLNGGVFSAKGIIYHFTLPNLSMDGWAVKDGSGFHLIVTNPTGYTVPLTSVEVGNTFYYHFSGESLQSTSITAPGTLVPFDGTIHPYSVIEINF